MINHNSELPVATLHKTFLRWLNVINQEESASILNISKRSQSYRIHQFLEDETFLKKNLKNYRNCVFIQLDPATSLADNYQEFEERLKKHYTNQKKYLVILVPAADRLIFEFHENLGFLNSFALNNVNSSILFFFEKNINLPIISKKIDYYPVLFQNILVNSPFDQRDIDHFIAYQLNKFKVSLGSKLLSAIKFECGNRLGLITAAIRYYSRTRDIEGIFTHDEMNLKVKLIWQEFEDEEQTLLKKIVKNDFYFTDDEKPILDFLVKTGVVKKIGTNNYAITIPLLVAYLEKQTTQEIRIRVDESRRIIINGVVVESLFSKREKKLVRYLIEHANDLIPRETVAEHLWGENYKDSYTDWALDQVIKRLREKFIKLGLHKDIIKTKKNLGFIFFN